MKRRLLAGAVLGVAMMGLLPAIAHSDGGKDKGKGKGNTYRVTITNLTAGQPFSPPVLVTHSDDTAIFSVGEPASIGIQQIAENGNSAPLQAALAEDVNVHQVVTGMAPLVPANNPGGTGFASSESYVITTTGKAKYLSFASMLICTNDGFTGLDSIPLPKKSTTVYSASYDARTEINTEDFADLVPPCQGLIGVGSDDPGTGMTNPLLAEDGVIIPHAGILGGTGLVADVHAWGDPVAKIEIERMR